MDREGDLKFLLGVLVGVLLWIMIQLLWFDPRLREMSFDEGYKQGVEDHITGRVIVDIDTVFNVTPRSSLRIKKR